MSHLWILISCLSFQEKHILSNCYREIDNGLWCKYQPDRCFIMNSDDVTDCLYFLQECCATSAILTVLAILTKRVQINNAGHRTSILKFSTVGNVNFLLNGINTACIQKLKAITAAFSVDSIAALAGRDIDFCDNIPVFKCQAITVFSTAQTWGAIT